MTIVDSYSLRLELLAASEVREGPRAGSPSWEPPSLRVLGFLRV